MKLSPKCIITTTTSDLSLETFLKDFSWKGTPVIVKQGFPECAAKNWTIDHLLRQCGNNQVYCRTEANSEEYRQGKKYGLSHMPFHKYVSILRGQVKNCPQNGYYMAVQNIKKVFPEIAHELILPEYVGKAHAGPFLWLGRKGHYEFCHMDPDDGFLMMIHGRKRVRLFHYRYLENLYPNKKPSKGRTIQSQVNCDAPNLLQFPLFEEAQVEEGILHPGDILFIPAFYWHQVSGLEDHDSDYTLSANIFFGDAGENTFIEKMLSDPYRFKAFSYWFLNIIEQNYEASPIFIEMLVDIERIIHSFFHTQYHEFISPHQTKILVHLIADYCRDQFNIDFYQVTETRQNFQIHRKHPTKLRIRGLNLRS